MNARESIDFIGPMKEAQETLTQIRINQLLNSPLLGFMMFLIVLILLGLCTLTFLAVWRRLWNEEFRDTLRRWNQRRK